MHKFRFFLSRVTLLGFLFVGQLYSTSFDKSVCSVLDEAGDSAILKIEENRIFLNPEKIVILREGIFLSTESYGLLEVVSLHSTGSGIYTEITESGCEVATVWPAVIRCRNCNAPFSKTIFNGGICPRCGTQN